LKRNHKTLIRIPSSWWLHRDDRLYQQFSVRPGGDELPGYHSIWFASPLPGSTFTSCRNMCRCLPYG